jgi:glyoxylase-like metal-dependent hydrolase (beta-lactamase superfamily II)
MPALAPIGVRVDNYLDVPDSAKGPAIDPAKGYRTQKLGEGLYMITDGAYQSMFMMYEDGVVVVDAPPSYAAHIRTAIGELSDRPITHLIYSHAHSDHIGGAQSLGGQPIIVAHAETNRLLRRDNDPNRPLATVTFDDRYRLSVGTQVLELSYHGNAHLPRNIFVYAPQQRTLMVIDVIFPGWMPWRRFAVAQDVPGYFEQVKTINSWDFDTPRRRPCCAHRYACRRRNAVGVH